MQATSSTSYITRYPLTILGQSYDAGKPIEDPAIPARVLQRLERTGKIALRVTGRAGPTPEPVAATEPAPPRPAEPAVLGEALVERPEEAPSTAGVAPDPETRATPATGRKDGYRRRWERAHRRAGDGRPFKAFLQAECAAAGLDAAGSVSEMVERLRSAEIMPHGAHG